MREKKFKLLVITFLSLTILIFPVSAFSPQNLTIHFIDVGYGDAILVQAPNDHEMLIDAGVSEAGSKVSTYISGLGITDLEIVTITHPHPDHIGGIRQILNDIHVDQIIENGDITGMTMSSHILHTTFAQNGIPVRIVKAGDHINLDPSIDITVLSPQILFSGDNSVNENSIVLKITKGNVAFLLEGDAGNRAENYMMSHGAPLDVDILKVGHHGDGDASSEPFLAAVTPKVSIISVGACENLHDPNTTILDRISQFRSKIYRTDINGNIVVTTDGNSYTVIPERSTTSLPLSNPIYPSSTVAIPTIFPTIGPPKIFPTITPIVVPTSVPTITPSKTYTPTGTGSITVTSDPPQAMVYLDGVFKGISPITISRVSSGAHQIKLVKVGYMEYSAEVNVITGRVSMIAVSLSNSPGTFVTPTITPTPIPTAISIPTPKIMPIEIPITKPIASLPTIQPASSYSARSFWF